jgi:hypothetical protein
MIALSGEELVSWVEKTTTGWRDLLAQYPEILNLPCDVRETKSVAELLQHIVAVELRYAERLSGLPETSYGNILFASSAEIFAAHDRAMALLRANREMCRTSIGNRRSSLRLEAPAPFERVAAPSSFISLCTPSATTLNSQHWFGSTG